LDRRERNEDEDFEEVVETVESQSLSESEEAEEEEREEMIEVRDGEEMELALDTAGRRERRAREMSLVAIMVVVVSCCWLGVVEEHISSPSNFYYSRSSFTFHLQRSRDRNRYAEHQERRISQHYCASAIKIMFRNVPQIPSK